MRIFLSEKSSTCKNLRLNTANSRLSRIVVRVLILHRRNNLAILSVKLRASVIQINLHNHKGKRNDWMRCSRCFSANHFLYPIVRDWFPSFSRNICKMKAFLVLIAFCVIQNMSECKYWPLSLWRLSLINCEGDIATYKTFYQLEHNIVDFCCNDLQEITNCVQ